MMQKLTCIVSRHRKANATMTISFEMRQRSRFRAMLDHGEEVGVVLERGSLLRGGDKIASDFGYIVEIRSAKEQVSTVFADGALQLARIAYHLGNRHVKLHIADGWVRYQRDHVLDEMAELLGGRVTHEDAEFEPESGAYLGHRHDE